MNCPICNKQEYYEWGKSGTFSILRCKTCGLGITSPVPSPEDLCKLNQDVYTLERRIQTYLSREDYFVKRYGKYIDKIKLYKGGGKLLDIGCNIGLFLKEAQSKGFCTTGIEVNKDCAAYGQEVFKLKIIPDSLENIGFEKDKFDVVTLFDVLEHIPDLKIFINEVRRILRVNGLLVLQLPNIESSMAKITKSKWPWLSAPDHLYHFTPKTIIQFLEANGFSIKEIRTWEPAEDFWNNLIMGYQTDGWINRVCVKILRLSKLPVYFISFIQFLWCNKLKGGLIELYAIKSEESRYL